MKRSLILTLLLLAITLASYAVGPVTGTLALCAGSSTSLADSTPGGSWISSNPSVATISPSGIVNGISGGTSTISYIVFSGGGGPEVATAVVTVNPAPVITGSSTLCVGSTSTYVGSPAGGVWSVGTTGVLSIGAGTGIANALAGGTTVISYTLPTGCYKTLTVSVTTAVPFISGPSTVCAGNDITLTHPATGGIWSSSTPPVATVASGVVHGITPGTTTISYVLGSGCSFASKIVTVTPGLAPISGASSVVVGSSTSLSATPTGGTWSSSAPAIATVSSSGFVSGISPGTAVITYSKEGCTVTKVITVLLEAGAPISGPEILCVGATASYSVADSGGGVWSSSHPTVADIDASGNLTTFSAGTTTISYISSGSGAISTLVITVSAAPPAIVGPSTVCLGGTILLTDAAGGGFWSSSNLTVATVSLSGVVTGIGMGTTTITYTLPSTGCFTTMVVTVTASAAPITGASSLCVGGNIMLSDATPGGIWSSSNPSIASIGATTGLVTGLSSGSVTVTYSVGGCSTTKVITVSNAGSISGPSTACIGFPTSYLSDSSGTWASSTPTVGTIGLTSGILTGITGGVTTITFTHAGCTTVKTVTVTAAPPAISGSSSVCTGATITLTDGTLGGTWSSSNAAVATVNVATGVVTGITPGTAIITYTIGTGCSVTKVITVSSGPGPISGPGSVCVGATITLTDPTPGGVWITSNIITAPISSFGVVTGGAVGSVTITYSLGGCKVTKDVSVVTTPAAITGGSTVCVGATITLADATSGGTWSSSSPLVATVSGAGVVTGNTAGVTTISYTNTCGSATKTVTVTPGPSAISGPSTLCVGTTVTETSTPAGGTWSVSVPVATIGLGTGIVTGTVPGTTVITYTLASGCYTTQWITVNPNPTAITGPSTVAAGSTISLSDATPGGVWSSSTPAIATINSVGTVTGVSTGITTITYTLPTGCYTTYVVTVTPASVTPPISGPTAICQGANVTYTETVPGTWTSSNGLVAVIDLFSGVLTPLLPGTTTVTFFPTPSGTPVSIVVTVNPQPTSLWASNVCVGNTILASTTSVGGTWISSDPSIATVGSTSGVVTGISAGAVSISYVYTSTGCAAAVPVTVNANPAPIGGTPVVCAGGTTTLTDATPGGIWSTTNPGVANVDPISGIVTGIGSGTVIINYTLGTTCWASITMTVTPGPAPISGPGSVCAGSSVTLFDGVSGGTWSSSNIAVASVGMTSGVVTGNTPGLVTISYSLGSGCVATKVMTVTAGASPISGTLTVCTGSTTLLTNTVGGGTWASSSPFIATVNAAGVVTGITFGTTMITYTLPGGCSATAVVTVLSTPAAISGPSLACVGSTITLTDAVTGGSWSSSNSLVATVSSTGVVTGVTSGIATISYTTFCGSATKTITVTPSPAAIAGPSTVCIGSTITLTDATPGGTWSSSTPTFASVGLTSGVVTGISFGTAVITYKVPSGCFVTKTVTVTGGGGPISGPLTPCAGIPITYTVADSGGTWASSAPTINPTTGVLVSGSAGIVVITYASGTGCVSTLTVTVSPAPTAITGPSSVCVGGIITLADATAGGIWTSSNTAVATINAATGVLTGISGGGVTITYTLVTGCYVTRNISVTPTTPITGPSTVCAGSSITLADATPGGAWSSSNPAVASVTTFTGVVTGMTTGTATITYSVGGCIATKVITVTSGAGPISGPSIVCTGVFVTYTASDSGGTWASTMPTINAMTGVFASMSSGLAIITYTSGAGCQSTKTVTVVPSAAAITGPSTVCVGGTITLADATPGGAWSSSNTAVATVNAAGVVTGISGTATATITYMLPTGCYATKTVTVTPGSVPISGPSTVCAGSSITLTTGVGGGFWSSSNPAVATVSPTGVVTGVTSGTVTIFYVLGSCVSTKVITVGSAFPITGPGMVCVGSSISLFDSVAGGMWSSSSPSIASVDSLTGVVSGNSFGVAIITYSSGGCIATTAITVNSLPAPITGSSTICVGSSTALTDATPGGTWSSSNTTVATVNTAGVVTGISTGTVTITYTAAGSGCKVTKTMTVTAGTAPISGPSTVCTGSTITLTDAVPGGTWSSSNPAIATINPTTGVLTGIANGSTVITYNAGGCMATKVITVSGVLPIFGGTTLCVGSTSMLYDSVFGGMWTSSNNAVASVDSLTGLVHGDSVGVAIITYSIGGCFATTTVTVNPGPAPITGSSTLCVGTTTTMTDATPGGTWSSTNTLVATISPSGVVTATGAGVTTIKYTLPSGCSATKTITVNVAPFPISGPSSGCVGSTIVLSDSISGGTWSSSNTSIATVGMTTGIVTGVHVGVVSITYSIGGCSTVKILTITTAPAAIGGSGTVCVGATTTLTDATAGGTWLSSDPSKATVSTTGVVTGISVGLVNIYYTVGGCSVSKTVTVNASPLPISGGSGLCVGTTLTLTDSIPGGVWTSSSPTIAAVGTGTGVVTGLSTGVATITYTIGSCKVTKTVTVSGTIAPITGSSSVCVGTTITLADGTAGGTWSSSNPAKATVTATGMVTGVSAGVVTIIYTKGGCSVSKTVTVNNAPAPIAGSGAICAGATLTLTDATPGGTWLSSNPLVATVGGSTGIVTGVSTGFIVAYYSVGGCSVYTTVTVSASPKAISGPSSLCAGATVVLSDLTPGGLWISSNIAIATVNPVGHVTGVSAGLVTISYLVGSCSATKSLTVNPCGKIGGMVKAGAGKGTDATIAVTGMLVELVDVETNNVVAQTNTDAAGAYEFIELGYGKYAVVPKEDGFSTTPSAAVAITKSSLIADNINFVKNNGDKTIAPSKTTGTAILIAAETAVNVYPNPSNGDLNITWDNQPTGTANVVVTNVVGTEVFKGTLDMSAASGQSRIDLKNLKSGIYLITIKSDNVSYSNKLFIQQ